MLKVYRTWKDGVETLVKANSMKEVRETLNVENVEFFGYLTKKREQDLKNVPVCNGKPLRLYYCVSTVVLPSGKIVKDIETSVLAEEKPASSLNSTGISDYRYDWFDSKEEAEKFISENN